MRLGDLLVAARLVTTEQVEAAIRREVEHGGHLRAREQRGGERGLPGDVRPELADLNAALSRALAKDPADRFDRCADFAVALHGDRGTRCTRCTTAAAITRPAPVAARAATGAAAAAKPPILRPAMVLPTILALMLIASIIFAGIQAGGPRQPTPALDAQATTQPQTPTPTPTSAGAMATTTDNTALVNQRTAWHAVNGDQPRTRTTR